MLHPMGAWASHTFAAFASPRFRILWLGSLLAYIAFFMSTVVQAVVAFDLSGNNRAVGFVVFAQGLAQLALGPLGGALADRLSKKSVILACQVTIMLCFAGLGVLVAADVIDVMYLAIGSFIIGMAFSFLGPSRQAFMLELVDQARRGNAVALSQVALNASRVVAPLIAGVMLGVGFIGPGGAYFGMGVLYVGAIACTVSLPATPPADMAAGRSIFGDIAVGVSYVTQTRSLRLLVLSYVLVIMFGFSYVTVLPGLVVNQLGRDADSITVLLGVNAIGGLAASLGVAAKADSRHAGAIYSAMCLVFALALMAMGAAPSFPLLGGAMLLAGFGSGGFQTLNGALVSHRCDPAYFGRVVSLTFLAFAASSVIALPIGFLADAAGERATVFAMGAAVATATVMTWLLDRSAGEAEPGIRVEVAAVVLGEGERS